MSKESKFCECCGAKTVRYRHSFSKQLAMGLYRLYESGGGPINLKHIGLTRYQWTNFQKLRYWGLVAPAHREDGTRIDGEWIITPEGKRFIDLGTAIQKGVWTYRGEAVEFDGNTCFFLDMHDPTYKKRPEYWAEAIAAQGDNYD